MDGSRRACERTSCSCFGCGAAAALGCGGTGQEPPFSFGYPAFLADLTEKVSVVLGRQTMVIPM